jgi:hypothetical protein
VPNGFGSVLQSDAKLVQGRHGLGFSGGIMPLHFGKIFALIALVTIGAFILWQLWVAFFVGETVEAPEPAALNQTAPWVTVAPRPV